MISNLTELLQNKVGQTLTQYVTDKLQESPTAAGKAVTMALPALLGGLVKNHADGNKMTALFDLITGLRVDSSATQLPSQETGNQLLGSVLGDTSWLSKLIASKSGISGTSAVSLLATAFPMVLGALRSHIQTGNLSQAQFAEQLSSQQGFLGKLLDGDFLGSLGIGAGLGAAGAALSGAGSTAAKTVQQVATPGSGGLPKWIWLVAAAAIAALFMAFCSPKKPAPESVPAAPASGVAPDAGTPPASEPALPASAVASEAASAAAPVNADDGSVKYENGVLSVYFATGKTDFDTALAQMLANDIVQQGKEGKKLAVSGFTDPRGNAKLNAELSKKRAQAVRDFLVAQGVPEANVELVKPKDTTGHEGSDAENRRVDVSVQ